MNNEIIKTWFFFTCLALTGSISTPQIVASQPTTVIPSQAGKSHSLGLLSAASSAAQVLFSSKWGLRAGSALICAFCLDPQGWVNKGTLVLSAANTYATSSCYSMLSRLKNGTDVFHTQWKKSRKHASQALAIAWNQLKKMEDNQIGLAQGQRDIRNLQIESLNIQEKNLIVAMQTKELLLLHGSLTRSATTVEMRAAEERGKKSAWQEIQQSRRESALRAAAEAPRASERDDNSSRDKQMQSVADGLNALSSQPNNSWGNGVYQRLNKCMRNARNCFGLGQIINVRPAQEHLAAQAQAEPAQGRAPVPSQEEPSSSWTPIGTARHLIWG